MTIGRGITYVMMGALGVALLLSGEGWTAALFGALLVLIGVGGLVMVSFPLWFERHRPGPGVAIAPSGASATFFRRSRFTMGLSMLTTPALAVWFGVSAFALYRGGHDIWAALLAGLALFLLWPVVVAAAGKVESGGLWLTVAGVEHRNGAVSWAVPWSDVDAVVAAEPILLQLREGARPAIERTVPWIWSYEVKRPEDHLGFRGVDLAGGHPLVVAMLAHYLGNPQIRDRLGTPESVPLGG